jgi:hypothetical protein
MAILNKVAAGAAIVAIACPCCAQQQKFPLTPGEWEVATTMVGGKEPIVLRVCLNDDLWTKALAPNPKCSIDDLNVTEKGVSYVADCPGSNYELKSTVEITFDGKSHMTAKGTTDLTSNGQTSTMKSHAEYRWTGPACNPNDVNLKYGTSN